MPGIEQTPAASHGALPAPTPKEGAPAAYWSLTVARVPRSLEGPMCRSGASLESLSVDR